MRDRQVRLVFLGLVLAAPVLILAAAPPQPPGQTRAARPDSRGTALGVEAVVIAGLLFAARQRRRLLADREIVATTPNRSRARLIVPRITPPHTAAARQQRPSLQRAGG